MQDVGIQRIFRKNGDICIIRLLELHQGCFLGRRQVGEEIFQRGSSKNHIKKGEQKIEKRAAAHVWFNFPPNLRLANVFKQIFNEILNDIDTTDIIDIVNEFIKRLLLIRG